MRRAGRAPGILSPRPIGSNRVRCCAAAAQPVGRTHLVASRDLTNGYANQLSVTLLAQQVNDPLTQSLAFHYVQSLTSAVLNCAFTRFPLRVAHWR